MNIFNGVVYLSEEQFKTLVKDETITVEKQKEDGTTESITIQYDRNSFFATPEEPPDKTLSKSGVPADAQTTGEKIAEVQASGKLYKHLLALMGKDAVLYDITVFSRKSTSYILNDLLTMDKETLDTLFAGSIACSTQTTGGVYYIQETIKITSLTLYYFAASTENAPLSFEVDSLVKDTVYEV